MTEISAMLDAPARLITNCASDMRPARRERRAAHRRRSRPRHRRRHALDILFAGLMADPDVAQDRLGQRGDGPGTTSLRMRAPWTAADHQHRHRVIARRDIGRARALQHRRAHRVADMHGPRRPGAGRWAMCRRPPRRPPREQPVHPAPARRSAHAPCAGGAISRPPPAPGIVGIAAEAHHHIGPVAQHPQRGAENAARDMQRGQQLVDQPPRAKVALATCSISTEWGKPPT